MNEVRLDIGLIEEQRFGQSWKVVTFTTERQAEPFHTIPYLAYKHYDTEFLRAVRAGIDAGYALGLQKSERSDR